MFITNSLRVHHADGILFIDERRTFKIKDKVIKLLWAAAAGRCCFPNCTERKLYRNNESNEPSFIIGEMAHICGEKPDSNRYNPHQSDTERNEYANMILLCPTHHTIIDKKENEKLYNVDFLLQIKRTHEEKILKFDLILDETVAKKTQISNTVLNILMKSHEVWSNYGPISNIAKKEPENERVHALWETEKLSTIIPNNRIITEILNNNIEIFSYKERKIISLFFNHVQSYERWVKDEIPYSAVARFPIQFEDMLGEILNVGI